MKRIFPFVLIAVLLMNNCLAQLTGIKTIPGDYASIAAAVSDLNTNGVGGGGVTFNIAAGYTETGNHTITATGTAANPIIFQKNGIGTNPTFTAGVGTGWDAIFKMVGTDYITFDGLTLLENPANAGGNWIEKTENGFGFFKVDATNGCQYNTVKNCTISLDRLFYQVDPGGTAHYSTAVYMYHANAGNIWINQESTASGTHSYNVIQNNTISNVEQGVFIYGYHNTSSGIAVIERHNEVKDNTINFGGNSVARAIRLLYVANSTISGNTISTHTAHQAGAVAINYSPMGKSGCLINNNTIQLDGTGVLNSQCAIQVDGGGGPMAADVGWKTITITGNTVLPSTTNYDYFGIYCVNGGAEFETIENNTINLSNSAGTNSGEAYGINVQNWWADATAVTIKNNIIQGHATSLTNFYGISNSDNTDLVTIENNKILNNSSSIYQGINISGSNGSVVKNNMITSATTNTHYTYIGLQVSSDGVSAINNYIGNRAAYSASAVAYGLQIGANGTTHPIKVYHNTVYIDGNPGSVNVVSAFSINSTQNIDARNNIFYNAMMPGVSGNNKLSAFANGQILSNTFFLSRNNLFWCGTPSATNSIYTDPNGNYKTFVDYKLKVCAKDVNSVSGTVPFLSLDNTNANYLHIDPAVPCLINDNGLTTPDVTVDYDGQPRNATTPDIGADELNGTAGTPNTMMTTPVVWLKADAAVYNDAGITLATNGQTVQQWNDQTCNGYNVNQSNSGWRPTWDQFAFNGKPAIMFDKNLGTKFLENITDNPVAAGAERTIFIVAKSQCGYNGGTLFTQRKTAPYAAFYLYNLGADPITLYSDGVNGASNASTTVNTNTNNLLSYSPFVATYKVPTNNGLLQFYVNGDQQTVSQSAGVTNESGTNGFTLATWDNLNDPLPWGGWIAEVMVYNKALTDGERQSVEAYLMDKYATTGLPVQFNGLVSAPSQASNTTATDASWKHTYHNSDNSKLIVSVKDFCLDLGAINSTVYNETTAGQYNGQYYMRRHFVINPTLNPVGTKRVRLYYTDADFSDLQSHIPGLTSASQLVVTKYSGANEDGIFDPSGGSTILISPSQITTGTVMGVNYLEFDVTGFSEFWIHTGNVVLPLQFLSFTAQKCGNNVCLNWKTANEQNVSHFEIERSADGRNFTTIKTEAAKNQPLNLYSYEDVFAGLRTADKVYYRIRQVDVDGKTKYSAIAFVKQNATLAEVYPTLFSKSFTIQNNSTDNVQLILYSTDGKILKNQSIHQGVNNVNFGGSYTGVLFYKLIKKEEVILTGKLIKQ